MSINSILNIATSGLWASQSGINNVSQNIANVNTKGYVRVDQNQSAVSLNGKGAGVSADSLRRAANSFFQAASIRASADASSSGIKSNYLDQVQSAFGDPSGDSSIFARIDAALGSFETAVLNPGSISVRRDIINQLSSVLSQLSAASGQIDETRKQIDSDISATIGDINSLLVDITKANNEITRGNIAGNSTGAQERQSQLIDKLSQLIDIRVDYQDGGTANIYTSDGAFLAGITASELGYQPSGAAQSTFNPITVKASGDTIVRTFDKSIQSGKLRGLLDLRNQDLSQISDSLGEFAGKLADAINSLHNTNAALPAIESATGSDTGLLAGDALNFTGKTTIGIVSSDGKLQRKIDIDFSAGTISVNGAAFGATGGTIGAFVANLNSALGGMGTASFANGKLSMNSATSGNGFVFDEPAAGGSLRGDKAFSHFFGLNNLINSSEPTSYSTGLSAGDAHGFAVGSKFKMRLSDASGQIIADREITIPAGTMGDIVNALNNPTTGFGIYGNYALDATGKLKWTPTSASESFHMNMTQDVAPRGNTSLSLGQITGLNQDKRFGRANALTINSNINANPRLLALADPDLSSATIGSVAVGLADSKGAQKLFNATKVSGYYDSALGLAGRKMTLGEFASTLAGDVGTRASTAEAQKTSATALQTEADTRRSNIEGVNLDEELVKLTSFQQAYAASARMIKAADEMYQTLLNAI
ncbi:MAG: flagellar hook-associated protein FlgK [Caulobacterales bacterium]|nr:flagellar hook-associated protein FlgK [Caulobacterales bacterium]MCA0371287.1 flagellar hook-associated protein FlgK [Pseudomonadota bacterium]